MHGTVADASLLLSAVVLLTLADAHAGEPSFAPSPGQLGPGTDASVRDDIELLEPASAERAQCQLLESPSSARPHIVYLLEKPDGRYGVTFRSLQHPGIQKAGPRDTALHSSHAPIDAKTAARVVELCRRTLLRTAHPPRRPKPLYGEVELDGSMFYAAHWSGTAFASGIASSGTLNRQSRAYVRLAKRLREYATADGDNRLPALIAVRRAADELEAALDGR